MFHVREIRLRGFTVYDEFVLELPRTGIVTITGPNGSGKSSIIEAVAWAGWGKMLRETVPWRPDGAKCVAIVRWEGLVARRQRTGKKNDLFWRLLDDGTETSAILDTLWRMGKLPRTADAASSQLEDDGVEYETASKAQDALVEVIGEFDVWRRSRAFSSHDAAHFTLATDAERKRLIESMLGLYCFDPALERCRADLKTATTKCTTHQLKLAELEASLTSEKRRLTEAKGSLEAMPAKPKQLKAKAGRPLKEFETDVSKAREELRTSREQLRDADRSAANLDADARRLTQLIKGLRDGDCSQCTQPITPALRDRLKLDAESSEKKATELRTESEGKRLEIEDLIAELEEEFEALVKKRDERQAELQRELNSVTEYNRHEAQRIRFETIKQEATQKTVELEDKIDEVRLTLADAQGQQAVLKAAEMVLGLRGVRASIMADSLAGIAAVANAWLPRMMLDKREISVELTPYTEKKTGGVSDSIRLQVHGAGGGLGYKATSGGERRRIDVGLLLAHAEVAAASAGGGGGTLFFDEVFDALDTPGKEAVSSILQELARDCCVVVVTHSTELQGLLPAVKRVSIAQGALAGVG